MSYGGNLLDYRSMVDPREGDISLDTMHELYSDAKTYLEHKDDVSAFIEYLENLESYSNSSEISELVSRSRELVNEAMETLWEKVESMSDDFHSAMSAAANCD